MAPVISFDRNRGRREIVADLQRLLQQRDSHGRPGIFTFGLPAIDGYLPQGGLSLGALHDIVPETPGDMAAAFGFIIALICRLGGTRPVLIATAPQGVSPGQIHGHGLNMIGLDPTRVILVEAEDEIQVHWVIEEALKSGVPAAIAAMTAREPDLRTSRRFHLAAEKAGLPLLLLRPDAKRRSSAAITRWRIGAAHAPRDRFGLLLGWRWRIGLERCRNGRQGEWLVEFDHGTHRFSLAAAMADPALPQGAIARFLAGRSG